MFKVLAKDPKQRFINMNAFGDSLEVLKSSDIKKNGYIGKHSGRRNFLLLYLALIIGVSLISLQKVITQSNQTSTIAIVSTATSTEILIETIDTSVPEKQFSTTQGITPTPESYFPITDCAPSRIHLGDVVFVSFGGSANYIRNTADTHPSDNKIGKALQGETMLVIGGPVCNYGWILWDVVTENGIRGWTAETDGNEYWLVPFTFNDVCEGLIGSALSKETIALVSPYGDSNRLRSGPSDSDEILTRIEPGEKVNILDGPICNNGFIWWNVQLINNGIQGWTAEGDNSDRWLIPLFSERK